jgi:hypothetical protein
VQSGRGGTTRGVQVASSLTVASTVAITAVVSALTGSGSGARRGTTTVVVSPR